MEARSPQPSPFLRVTVGSPVVSADDEKLGSVKEVHAQAFKVATGLFHRDVWLPAYIVAEAVPEDIVILSVTKAQLDEHKLKDEPEAA